mmetsp:Transcript_20006/g.79798  ORF Transcript_20006/g.79798 Transcript_20006/m.79798 type:complete len:278 (+) Transcript_20006:252-1085(+)
MEQSDDLGVIVTGAAGSGTTVLSSLIKNHPSVMGGFELGVLDADEPAKWGFGYMLRGQGHIDLALWNVSDADISRMKEAECLADMYSILRTASPYLRETNQRILDKCPGYSKHMEDVIERAPPGAKIIVSVKQGHRSASVNQALATHPDQVLEVNHTELLVDPHTAMRRVFEFIGFGADSWSGDYIHMRGLKEKITPFMGATIAAKIARHYEFHSDGGKCDRKRMARSGGTICHGDGAPHGQSTAVRRPDGQGKQHATTHVHAHRQTARPQRTLRRR